MKRGRGGGERKEGRREDTKVHELDVLLLRSLHQDCFFLRGFDLLQKGPLDVGSRVRSSYKHQGKEETGAWRGHPPP